jgi:hypothetical protein
MSDAFPVMSEQLLMDGLCFGQMLEIGFTWGRSEWPAAVYALTPPAVAFFSPKISDSIENFFYDYFPGDLRPPRFARNLKWATIMAVNRYGPLFSALAYPSIMPDGSMGTPGALNLQDNGQMGWRKQTVNSDFPQTSINPQPPDNYASDAETIAYGDQGYQSSLTGIIQALGVEDGPQYDDAINRVLQYIDSYGVFSKFMFDLEGTI